MTLKQAINKSANLRWKLGNSIQLVLFKRDEGSKKWDVCMGDNWDTGWVWWMQVPQAQGTKQQIAARIRQVCLKKGAPGIEKLKI